MRAYLSTIWVVSVICTLTGAVAFVPDQQVLLPPPIAPHDSQTHIADASTGQLDFTLRHIYHKGSHRYPDLFRAVDVDAETRIHLSNSKSIHSLVDPRALKVVPRPTVIQRIKDRDPKEISNLVNTAQLRGYGASLPSSAWTLDKVHAPNTSDIDTIRSFAYMAADAYISLPRTGNWHPIKGTFNYTEDFGWEEDGLRGHIFADTTNSTVVIGLKGTSPAVFDGADTTGNDKLNDNLFGSCCCGQGGQYWWKHVCDCQTTTYTCNNTCLTKSLREKSHYYHAAKDLYLDVTERYPDAEIWLTGHSLGGVVTSLLGLTFGLPTITFEAFPDALAAGRLGLPTPPGYRVGQEQSRLYTGITHFGHSADPVYMGICNSASSACTIGGYAFQSQCHTGQTCTFDTVGDFGWRVGIGTHKIESVVKDVLPKYDHVPPCQEDTDCVDCFNWSFFESNGTETTTSASSASSTRARTRTATCETPGWWGCLDPSTTASLITQTSTITTTTCLTPGWFGCKETANLTQTTTITTQTDVPLSTTVSLTSTTTTDATRSHTMTS